MRRSRPLDRQPARLAGRSRLRAARPARGHPGHRCTGSDPTGPTGPAVGTDGPPPPRHRTVGRRRHPTGTDHHPEVAGRRRRAPRVHPGAGRRRRRLRHVHHRGQRHDQRCQRRGHRRGIRPSLTMSSSPATRRGWARRSSMPTLAWRTAGRRRPDPGRAGLRAVRGGQPDSAMSLRRVAHSAYARRVPAAQRDGARRPDPARGGGRLHRSAPQHHLRAAQRGTRAFQDTCAVKTGGTWQSRPGVCWRSWASRSRSSVRVSPRLSARAPADRISGNPTDRSHEEIHPPEVRW